MAAKQQAHAPSKRKVTVFNKKLEEPFEAYWNKDKVKVGLKHGELIQGSLRINLKKFEEAFVDDPAGGPDFFINGVASRNRALNDDCVLVQVLPLDQWIIPESDKASVKGAIKDHVKPDEMSSPLDQKPSEGDTLVDRLYASPSITKPVGGPESVEPLREAVSNTTRRTAKVVYIVEKIHSRASAGYLKAYDKAKKLALFAPRDYRVPRVFVPLDDCPQDFPSNMKKYENNLFVCHIKQWPEVSPLPHGRLMRSLGEAGEVERESEAFMLENEVDFSDFSQEVLDCLPQKLPWVLPQEEVGKRRDFRKECVFTIDPDTARDLDDALHVKQLDSDTLEVGVHIADVSYFVTPETPLDKLASQRATSVYLVQKVIPMLPRLLCEQLCSLNPNEDRLTFSVVWTLSSKGKLISEWFGRSIIRSCAKLSYDHAQLMIDGEKSHQSFPPVHGGFPVDQVAAAVIKLNKLAKELRSCRESKGTLRLDQIKLKYSIDPASGLPNGCQPYKHKESNRMIEEFMLMANMAVARRIHQDFPELAMLRRHPSPKAKAVEMLAVKLKDLGIELDTSTAGGIQRSLDSYCGQSGDHEMEKLILISQCSKIMELAKYFSAGFTEVNKYQHYALNVPFYTHFTSPIRRYADVVVHRQLAAALREGPPYSLTCDEVQEQANHCNKKKKAAKTVEELSSELFLYILIKECGPFRGKGMVTALWDQAFDVFVRDFGVVKRVYCEKLSLKKFTYISHGEDGSSKLTLQWEVSGQVLTQVLKVLSVVDISVRSGSSNQQYEVDIHPPMASDT